MTKLTQRERTDALRAVSCGLGTLMFAGGLGATTDHPVMGSLFAAVGFGLLLGAEPWREMR